MCAVHLEVCPTSGGSSNPGRFIVARREHYEAIHELRAALPEGGTVWLIAYDRRGPGYYYSACAHDGEMSVEIDAERLGCVRPAFKKQLAHLRDRAR